MPIEINFALGAVVAALITGAFSLLSLIISKETKISEFRQEWINSLRREIAELDKSAANLAYYLKKSADESGQNNSASEKIEDARAQAILYSNMIKLRLNPNEIDGKSKDILEGIRVLAKLAQSENSKFKDINDARRNVVTYSRVYLKNEWDRVKHGEPVFRGAINSFIAFMIAFSIFGLLLILKLINPMME